MIPLLKTFKAVEIKTSQKKFPSEGLLKETIKHGFIFSPEIVGNYSQDKLFAMIEDVKNVIGLSGEKMNASFHKSWNKIKTAPIEQLFIEQLIHYVTTYGFKSLGFYSDDTIFIPNEKLDIPDIESDTISLIIIHGYTKKQLKIKVLELLSTGIALKEDTVKDIAEIAMNVGIEPDDIDKIKNKEVKILLYKSMGIIPENPIEFLRYIVYETTGSTLLIKSEQVLSEIRDHDNNDIFKLFKSYEKEYSLEMLATIFNRFTQIFISLKEDKMSNIINRISKLSKKHHIPLPQDYLNEITGKIKRNEKISEAQLIGELKKVNTFRKIRLAYALKFRLTDPQSIMYRIRNGKAWSTSFDYTLKKSTTQEALYIIMNSVLDDIKKNVEGKKIYIPDNIRYALPATEKQFTGDFPSGTYVSIPNNMVVGIHWFNAEHDTIDLDLSMISPDGKIGWDGSYRSETGDILFSGDLTSAPKPKGASELFYIKKQSKNSLIMIVNHYDRHENSEGVPFSIIVGKSKGSLRKDYMIDPNDAICIAKSEMTQKMRMLGLLVTTMGNNRFYFAEAAIGGSITSSNEDYIEHARKYLFNYYENTMSLNDLIVDAGGIRVKDKKNCDIDLSPNTLEKDTIINILK